MRSATGRLVTLTTAGLFAVIATAVGAGRSGENLFPTKVGSTWEYVGTAGKQAMTQKAVITSSSTSKGKTTAIMHWTAEGRNVQDETYLVSASGVSRAKSGMGGNSTISPPLPIIKYPMAAGKSWTWKGTVSVNNQITIPGTATLSVKAKQKVSTRAGSYNAYPVNLSLTMNSQGQKVTINNTYWFAEGAGIVKQTASIPAPSGNLTVTASVTKVKIP